jgi:hypothetical protein
MTCIQTLLRIDSFAQGSSRLIADSATEGGQKRNRRVEIEPVSKQSLAYGYPCYTSRAYPRSLLTLISGT